MRVAVVSDIHGNRRALQAVLADLKRVAPDLIVHGGDLAFGGTHPAEVIDEVRALGWPGVLGNTEEILWKQARLTEMAAAHPKLAALLGRLGEMIAPMRERVGDERLRWLQTLPAVHAGEGFAVVHASPRDLWRAPMANAADEEIRSMYSDLGAPIVIYGHIHVSYVRPLSGITVANAGSISHVLRRRPVRRLCADRRRKCDDSARGVRRGKRSTGAATFGPAPRGMVEPDTAGRKILPAGVTPQDK